MVSSLKLWHHPEHKRLWPIVGGLSVLAHVGILGLSLPYVLELMQSDSATQTAAPIPIELVDAASDIELGAETDAVTPRQNDGPTQTPISSQSEDAASSLEGRSSAPSQATSTPQQDAIATNPSAPTRSPESSAEQDRSGDSPAAPLEAETTDRANSRSDSARTSGEQTSPTSKQDDSAGDSGANSGDETNTDNTDASPAEDSERGSASDSATENPSNLPRVPSEGETLSPPGQSSVAQQTALSIVSFSEVPEAQRSDLGKTPPQPKSDTLSNEIVIDPVSRNCPRVAFSQQRWTYRIAVNPNGSVRTASVWTEGRGREMTEEERAIACLIENAGFEFEPALAFSDNQPILDDNLLIDVDIAEAR